MEVSKILQGVASADLNCKTEIPNDREKTVNVQFDSPFTNPPIVHGSISNFDHCTTSYFPGRPENVNNFRLRYDIENITNTGCQIKISTWGDSAIYNATINWIAFGN